MLNHYPREQLILAVKEYGGSIINDGRRFRGLLRDLAPNHQRETNLILAALEQKIPFELERNNTTIPLEIMLNILTQRLHDNLGIQKEFAAWAVESWALALGVLQQPISQQTKSKEVANQGCFEAQSILDETTFNKKTVIDDDIVPFIHKTGKYILQENGIAIDKKTGLMWLRFSYGQEWIGNKIIGTAIKLNRIKSMEVTNEFNKKGYANFNDWNIPNIKQLKTLIDKTKGENRSCINELVFPGRDGKFWSSTPYASNDNYSWNVDFVWGREDWCHNGNSLQIRFVRNTGPSINGRWFNF